MSLNKKIVLCGALLCLLCQAITCETIQEFRDILRKQREVVQGKIEEYESFIGKAVPAQEENFRNAIERVADVLYEDEVNVTIRNFKEESYCHRKFYHHIAYAVIDFGRCHAGSELAALTRVVKLLRALLEKLDAVGMVCGEEDEACWRENARENDVVVERTLERGRNFVREVDAVASKCLDYVVEAATEKGRKILRDFEECLQGPDRDSR